MTTAWNQTRNQLAQTALRKVGNLARGQTPNADDLALALNALDGALKELPIFGYAWPRTASGQATLALTAGLQNIVLPTDYYGGAMVSFVDASGQEVPLPLVTLQEWNRIPLKTQAAAYPTQGYIDNFNVLRVYPVQNITRVGKLVYQKIISDTVDQTVTELGQAWMLALPYKIAFEIGDEFGVSGEKMTMWNGIWVERRTLLVQSGAARTPDYVTTDD